MPIRVRTFFLLLAPIAGMAAADLSPACRQAASALDSDFLNVKEQSPITLRLFGDDATEKTPIVLGPSTPGPLAALGQYLEGTNTSLPDILKRSTRNTAALNTLLNGRRDDAATQTAYTDCSNELGLAKFFDLVARNSDASDWAAVATNVHSLFASNRGSLTSFLYHWDKKEPLAAIFFLFNAVQQDPRSVNNFRAAYNADGPKLAQIIRAEVGVICKWDDIVSVSQFEREHNAGKFQGFLSRLDQQKTPEAYDWLYKQLLGKDQASKDNFGACRKADAPRVDCIAHKAFNHEQDFDKCASGH
jgi:hypothetical protein